MTKADLMQLKKLIAEKDDLEQRLLTLKFNPNEELADTVKDYRTGFPKTIIIRGYGDNNWQKLHSKWAEKLAVTAKRVQDMEAFLDSIKDAEIRQILRLRYIDGLRQTHGLLKTSDTEKGRTLLGRAVQKGVMA